MAVNKTKAGVWYYKVDWKDSRGIAHQKKKQNSKWKKTDAQKEERLFHLSLENSMLTSDMTYGELYEHYKEAKKEEIKERSYMAYDEQQATFILPTFKDMQLSSIDRNAASRWQLWLLKQTNNGAFYSNSYLKAIQSAFKQVMNWDVEEGYIKESPIKKKNAKRNNELKKEMSFWTPGEFNEFYSTIDDLQDKVSFRLLFWGGLRKGEMIGLNIEDYDSFDSVITINKQWNTRNKKLATPKNKLGYRKISLDKETAGLIEELLNQYRKFYGFSHDCPLIGFNKRLPAQTLENRKNRYILKSKVKDIRIHDFRHSHASYLINQGFQPIDVTSRLGHTVTETLDWYGHLYPDRQGKMALTIDKSHKTA